MGKREVSDEPAPATPDPRREQLVELLGQLPAHKAEKLREMLQALVGAQPISPLLADIIERLALRAGDAGEDQPNALMRRVCTLFEPYLVSLPEQAADWTILRSSLMPWWSAAMAASAALRRCEESFIEAVRAQDEVGVEKAVTTTFACVSEVTQTLSIRGASAILRQDLRKMAALLANRTPLGRSLAVIGIGGPVRAGQEIELDEALVAGFAEQYLALARGSALDPIWLGHAVMNRLARPWTGVLLAKAVAESGEISLLAQSELAPLLTRGFSHLIQLARTAETQLRRAAKTKNAVEITRAAVLTERYFAALDEVAVMGELGEFSHHAQATLTEQDCVIAALADTLSLFEGVVAGFLHHWTPRLEEQPNPELSAALDVAGLLGTVKALGDGYSFDRPLDAILQRLAEALARTPPVSTSLAARQWNQHRAGLMHSLRLALD
jgi:hypothetical protein